MVDVPAGFIVGKSSKPETHIWYQNKKAQNFGELDVDQQENKKDPVEHVFVRKPLPEGSTWIVAVRNYKKGAGKNFQIAYRGKQFKKNEWKSANLEMMADAVDGQAYACFRFVVPADGDYTYEDNMTESRTYADWMKAEI